MHKMHHSAMKASHVAWIEQLFMLCKQTLLEEAVTRNGLTSAGRRQRHRLECADAAHAGERRGRGAAAGVGPARLRAAGGGLQSPQARQFHRLAAPARRPPMLLVLYLRSACHH
jgi:hypothetical protein